MSDPKFVDIGSPETRVIEECSELIKALCKVDRFGWFSYHPATLGFSNLRQVESEMKDVIAAFADLKRKIKKLREQRRATPASLAKPQGGGQ